ncbi:DDE-type integrase/transposase/recombinase [Acidovorax sp. SUPP1855]|uniref:integrase n=1 Tax=Acidovorax sp. SUPP1855 TaxID=431774 RepID=UPI0023DE3BD7|nr:integrase [Acidovorax sp. SUPP1855]GKS85561.1 DDE-type integrase/transposase/recombinase [Acidovorax sp. SUPP1855]
MARATNPAITQRLVHYSQALQAAPWGAKTPIYEAASAELQLSVATVIRKIKEVSIVSAKPRKRRCDAGQTALTRDEAARISFMLLEHMRKNNKRLKSIADAVEDLRANELIRAERVDSDGEILRLSTSAIIAALRTYRLHPDQLLAPAPAVHQASRHPNHVWQIDASRSVLFYLPSKGKDTGLRMTRHDEDYSNKPDNLVRVIQASLWRYVVTDHTSGAIFVWYVTGGETGGNLAETFIQAMHQREGNPFHGVPVLVTLDPGGANTSPPFLNLCKALRVRVVINKPKNPRAKGQVEKAQDMVERSFESTFKLMRLETLEEINAAALKWARWFNATQVHSRHGMTRFEAFMRIQAEQLVIAPGIDLCRELAVSAPQERTVNDFLEVEFLGETWDVSHVPGVIVRQKLQIVRNAWRPDSAQAIGVDDAGREVYHVLERKERSEFGFLDGAAVIGEQFKAHAETPAQRHMKEIDQLATGTTTVTAAEAARKAQAKGKEAQPAAGLRGMVDPMRRMNDAVLPSYLPRKGTALDVANPVANAAVLDQVDTALAIQRIAKQIGRPVTRDENRFIKARWPEVMPDDQVDALVAQFQRGQVEQPEAFGGLRAVGM